MARTRVILLLAAALLFGQVIDADAKVVTDRLFADNMVLQCDMAVPVWGTADPGEKVTVEFAGQVKEATAGKDGKWIVRLDPLKMSNEGRDLVVTSTINHSSLIIHNVVVGEVWFGSGQSNMAQGPKSYIDIDPVLIKMVKSGPYPGLRLYKSGKWSVADEASISNFSAILFAFGLQLQQELKVPVGLMYGAAGGTPSGRWLTDDMAAANEDLLSGLKKAGYTISSLREENLAKMKPYNEIRKQYNEAVKKARAEGKDNETINRDIKRPDRFSGPIRIGDLYERHVQQYIPYGIRGVLWDQGESKTQIPGVDQFTTMTALISGWRKVWGQGDFPFLHYQKPSGEGCAWDYKNPVNRLAVKFASLPTHHVGTPGSLKYNLDHISMRIIKNAPLVTTMDLAPGIHPPNKSGYGMRAVRVALGTVYGRDIAVCGPVYKSHKAEGEKLRVEFDNIGRGLAFKHGDKLQGFEVAGTDGKWAWADAVIENKSVVLSSSEVPEPVNVQYAFNRRNGFANLFNKDGLPALMFTTAEYK